MSELISYLRYPFVIYALIVGVLISLCAAVLGVSLVLKRFSFIGDGLSHVAFGATAVAGVLNIVDGNMLIVMPVTVLTAVLILRTSKGKEHRGDAAIAAVSVGALALGYLLMNIFTTSSNVSGDVCSTLFGSTAILTLTDMEVWICVGVSAVVLTLYIVFYNRIFAVTFDEDFANSCGVNAGLYNTLFAVAAAVVIVLAMKLAGSLLTSALIVFPALSAMKVCGSFRKVIITSATISVACAVLGIMLSIVFSTPVGATIVAVDVVVYLLCACFSGIIKK